MFTIFIILFIVVIISISLLLLEGFVSGYVIHIDKDNPDAGFLDNR